MGNVLKMPREIKVLPDLFEINCNRQTDSIFVVHSVVSRDVVDVS